MQSSDKNSESWDVGWGCCPQLKDCHRFFTQKHERNSGHHETSPLRSNNQDKNRTGGGIENHSAVTMRRFIRESVSSDTTKSKRDMSPPTGITNLTNLVKELFRNDVKSNSSESNSGYDSDSKDQWPTCTSRAKVCEKSRVEVRNFHSMEKSSHEVRVSFKNDDRNSYAPEKHENSRGPMDSKEWRKVGKEMVDYIANYLDTIGDLRVTPKVEPGYLRPQLPDRAPLKSESWDRIMSDFNEFIMPGITHWQHPRFHAYFPSGVSYPSILADMLSDAIGCIGFSWAASPACTELETILLDWVGRAIGLPEEFLSSPVNSKGGGVIQGSASDCVLVSLLAARFHTIKQVKQKFPQQKDAEILSKLMAYCSKEAHSCVEKAAMIGFVKLRILDTDKDFRMEGSVLSKAIQEDKSMGLIPFFVSTTLGTTSCCSFDPIREIGEICEKEQVWLHVDAAYAGNAFVCPEFQYLLKGIEYASSFNTNPNKFMLANFDCSLLWVRDRFKLTQALVVDPLYLQHSYSDNAIDYRHWSVPLSRRFRALKLWFVIRSYGIEGLQKYVRKHCRLAKYFERIMLRDERFEIMNHVILGLVCFRLKGSNDLNQKLLSSINASGELHMVPASMNDKFVIRFCVCAQNACDEDILFAYETISQFATKLLEVMKSLEVEKLEAQVALEKKEKKMLIDEVGKEKNTKLEEIPEVKDEKLPDLKEENESVDKVIVLDRRKKASLRYKRSFFVRMVSDPKLYNPKIVKALSTSNDQTSEENECNEILSPI